MAWTTSAIAVDAGGSTTRALVVAADGQCGPIVRSGPGNPISGAQQAATNIADACAAAMSASQQQPDLVVATVAGILSKDFPELTHVLTERDLPTRLVLVSDLLGAYFSGTAAPDGSVMIVGTGAVAAKVSGGRLSAVRDGLGWLLGDSGSGFWIGQRVARAVAAALDGRGPETSLTPRVLELLVDVPRRSGARQSDVAALLTWSHARRPVELAQLAILAAEEADSDPISQTICSEAASHALRTLGSLPGSAAGPVVIGGGVLHPGSPVGRDVLEALGGRAKPVSDGVAGAALMAIKELGGSADDNALQRITTAISRR